MNSHALWLTLILLVLTACDTVGNASQNPSATPQVNTVVEEKIVYKNAANCPFNKCFGDDFVAHYYFDVDYIGSTATDAQCDKEFKKLVQASDFLCMIKEITAAQEAGFDSSGKTQWKWTITCGCSYQK